MAFPTPAADNIYSLRISETGTGSAQFSDNEFEFFHPVKTDQVAWSRSIRIKAAGGALEFSFDGVNIHGRVSDGEDITYWDRHESGIAIRGAGMTFLLEAW